MDCTQDLTSNLTQDQVDTLYRLQTGTDDLSVINRWLGVTLLPRQHTFLQTSTREGFWGGSVGSAKTFSLFCWLVGGVDTPGYSGLALRRNYNDLVQKGGLLNLAHRYFRHREDVHFDGKHYLYEFPSGARIQFGHCEHEDSIYRYQGGEFTRIAVDEACNFLENQYTFLLTRLRRTHDNPIPPQIRAAGNPHGVGVAFIKQRFISDEAVADIARGIRNGVYFKEGRTFVPSFLEDNTYLNSAEYDAALAALPTVMRAQLRDGRWDLVADALFNPAWLTNTYSYHNETVLIYRSTQYRRDETARVISVDTAGSKSDSACKSAVAVLDYKAPYLFVREVWADRLSFTELVPKIAELYRKWGGQLIIENAHFGAAVQDALKSINIYAKLQSTAVPKIGQTAKVTRATKLMAAAEAGHLLFPESDPLWSREAKDELATFTGLPAVPSDRVDALSHGVNYLLSNGAGQVDASVYNIFKNFGRAS